MEVMFILCVLSLVDVGSNDGAAGSHEQGIHANNNNCRYYVFLYFFIEKLKEEP